MSAVTISNASIVSIAKLVSEASLPEASSWSRFREVSDRAAPSATAPLTTEGKIGVWVVAICNLKAQESLRTQFLWVEFLASCKEGPICAVRICAETFPVNPMTENGQESEYIVDPGTIQRLRTQLGIKGDCSSNPGLEATANKVVELMKAYYANPVNARMDAVPQSPSMGAVPPQNARMDAVPPQEVQVACVAEAGFCDSLEQGVSAK
ncbi:MAG: hypothetical protein KGR16_02845 [Verrucomicrobia bacterium]|nr:hypothetical protein [Verrucomicrobiota bacterium]